MRSERLLSKQEINDILDHFSDWMSYSNIVEMDIRQSRQKGGIFEVSLFVGEIEDLSAVVPQFGEPLEIPKTADLPWPAADGGSAVLPVEVAKRQQPVQQVLLAQEDAALVQAKQRPCPGGYLIHSDGMPGSGSIALSIMVGGKYRLLSNNHVLSNNGIGGRMTYQPVDKIKANELLAVSGYVPITYYADPGQEDPVVNEVDIGWCDTHPSTSLQMVRDLDVPGRRDPVVGEEVKVFGGASEVWNSAKIRSTTLRYVSHGVLGYAWWKNAIELDKNITIGGDSGSAYIAKKDNMLVGLHCTGGTTSIGCHVRVP